MHLVSLWSAKTTLFLLSIFGRQGASLPGLIAEKLDKEFLPYYLNKLKAGVIIVTGTNGKTTTTKMLTGVVSAKYRVMTNPTGSNFTRGIASSIVKNSSIFGRLNYDMGIFELDEAYAAKLAEVFRPRGVVALNIARDQMDRFGEIDKTAMLVQKVVKKATDFVVLNRDDIRVCNMKVSDNCTKIFFGAAPSVAGIYHNQDKETITEYKKAEVELQNVNQDSSIYKFNGKELEIKLKAHGTYNALNAAAVFAAAINLDIPEDVVTQKISNIKSAFGRGEITSVADHLIMLQLVKNPSAFEQALISADKMKISSIVIAINDLYADGRDVSWLWDVDFSSHANMQQKEVITTGSRAFDMALRLKYDEISASYITEKMSDAVEKVLRSDSDDGIIIIYATYTAMLKIRSILSKKTMLDEI